MIVLFNIILEIYTVKNSARFQIFPIEGVTIHKDIGMGIIGFWQGYRAAVGVQGAVFHHFVFGGVEMSVKKYVALIE